jgi:hypothetical protein
MKQILITRQPDGNVKFKTVSINHTQNVFFTNLDPQEAHWPYLNPKAKAPDFCDNQLGKAPSPNSSQCIVPPPQVKNPKPPPDLIYQAPPYVVSYGCKFHPDEHGTVKVFPQLSAPTTTLPAASLNQPLPAPVQVVAGGKSPYGISGQQYQITDDQGNVKKSGDGNIGPGLQLNPDQVKNQGITLSGTPSVKGNYTFTFVVDDGMGQNLQQVQYSMKVS